MISKIRGSLNGSYEELRKVEWPSRKDTMRLTAYVIGVSLLVGLFVAGIDYFFKEALTYIVTS